MELYIYGHSLIVDIDDTNNETVENTKRVIEEYVDKLNIRKRKYTEVYEIDGGKSILYEFVYELTCAVEDIKLF